MKTFLYVRGQPGVGKITISRELEKALGWKLFWFHDLKNAVQDIVKEHRIPRLMDEVVAPVARFLLEKGQDIIYVRPSPDKETVENIRRIVSEKTDYRFVVVQLTASYETLLARVQERADPYRISTPEALDSYLREREMAPIEGERLFETDGRTPAQVANDILASLQNA